MDWDGGVVGGGAEGEKVFGGVRGGGEVEFDGERAVGGGYEDGHGGGGVGVGGGVTRWV